MKKCELVRTITGEGFKGTKNYLKTQRPYEAARTILLFALSAALFFAGYLGTGTRNNLLTIVAVLGCLPASKSLVSLIMFCRYSGLSAENAALIEQHTGSLNELFDMVFTGREHTYIVAHLVVKGDTVCGFTEEKEFDENAFCKHITPLLKADRLNNVTVKVFRDLPKYLTRLDSLQELKCEETNTKAVINTLKSISL